MIVFIILMESLQSSKCIINGKISISHEILIPFVHHAKFWQFQIHHVENHDNLQYKLYWTKYRKIQYLIWNQWVYRMILDSTISSYYVINTHVYFAFVGFMTNPPMHILMILSCYYPLFHHPNITQIHTPYLVWYRHRIQIWYFLRMVFGKQSNFSTAAPKHQEQNRLMERYWVTVAKLANTILLHTWLNRKIFYYAIKHAQCIHDILLVRDLYDTDVPPTTPHQYLTTKRKTCETLQDFLLPFYF